MMLKPESFVLYSILSDRDKISYISDLFNAEDEKHNDITNDYMQDYVNIFPYEVNPYVKIHIYYLEQFDSVLHIFDQGKLLHFNSDRLVSINYYLTQCYSLGYILTRNYEYKKTKHNKDKFHLRYYRAYNLLGRATSKLEMN